MARLSADDDGGTALFGKRRFGVIRWLATSLVVRLIFVLLVFAAVPVVLYHQLRAADAEKRNLLLESSQREGALIGAALRSRLEAAGSGIPGDLNEFLSGLAGPDTGIKLLLSPGDGAARDFFYVAAAPAVPTSALEYERAELIERGILSRLAETCSGNVPIALRIPRDDASAARGSGARQTENGAGSVITGPARSPSGGVPPESAQTSSDNGQFLTEPAPRASTGVEILTSITPIRTQQGCWALVTSHSTDSFLQTSIGQPYWMTQEVRIAGTIYLSMALLITIIFVAILRNLRRFGRIAREIQRSDGGGGGAHGPAASPSFAAQNTVPELHDVAREFDRLVTRLRDSADNIRRAAEDNAHAFKTPLGIIRQSLEPLRRVAGSQKRAVRSVELVEQAVARLDTLVSLARQVDQTSADTVEPDRERIDLSRLLTRMMDGFSALESRHEVTFSVKIANSLFILGEEEMLETVVENLVDNAVSFSPPGGRIDIALQRDGATAVLTVTDEGPGVDPEKIPRIFDRYYSDRPSTDDHFGIGLWIVRRYVEALGGRVTARNTPGRGLRVLVRLELVQ